MCDTPLCGAHGDLSTLEYSLRPHSLGEIGRDVYFREILVQHLTFYVIIQCSDKMAVRSKAWLWGSTAWV